MHKEDSDNKEFPLLSKIQSPSDLRRLELSQLPQLCAEIRRFLINDLSSNPGHFASSMGAVDLIVALHYVFDTPYDNIVWDVGHQAYAHKIITGRREEFHRQRTKGGISGFPNPLESEYDTFMAGHAGNSISAALGMAVADMSNPERSRRKTVAVIGDASISNGLAFEGLNNASNQPNNLLIVLNDNDMSIDPNVGALHHYLSELSTSPRYNRLRRKAYNYMRQRGMLSEKRKGRFTRLTNSIKGFISKQKNIFEGLNIRYFGPFDGHDVIKLVTKLREIKDFEGPRLLHLLTVKGKGFEVAEDDPTTWHAPGKFDPDTGIRQKDIQNKIKSDSPRHPLWQDVFGDALLELAKLDSRVIGITAAMPSGTSMSTLMEALPERGFDVGISEGHAVTFAAGLAKSGKRPFVAIYSSFLQRAYDNIIHDVAIEGLPLTLCIDRAGLVGEDGVTHHGLFDLAYLRLIPGMAVAAPSDSTMLRNLLFTSLFIDSPVAIRYPRGKVNDSYEPKEFQTLSVGKGRRAAVHLNSKVAILSVGPILKEVIKASENLASVSFPADVYDMIWVKPLDRHLLHQILSSYDAIVTVEDGTTVGGFGSAVAEFMAKNRKTLPLTMLGVDDRWIHHASVSEQRQEAGIDVQSIENAVKDLYKDLEE